MEGCLFYRESLTAEHLNVFPQVEPIPKVIEENYMTISKISVVEMFFDQGMMRMNDMMKKMKTNLIDRMYKSLISVELLKDKSNETNDLVGKFDCRFSIVQSDQNSRVIDF